MVNCPQLHITFLGTGTSSGVPMIACNCEVCTSANPYDNRLRSSILVQSAQTTLVIDTTPDFRFQMLRESVKKLDSVLFTHPHKDHIAGLDDIRAYNFFQQQPINIFANEMTIKALHREFHYIFADFKYPGIPDVIINPIESNTFWVGDIPITPIKVYHLNMPVLGFRMGDFTYITDANKIEKGELEKIKGSKILVINALRKKPHISHFNLEEACELIKNINIPTGYLTHISHQMGLHEEVSKELPEGIHLAYDGLKIVV